MAKKRIEAQLGLNNKEFQQKLQQAQGSLQKFAGGLMKLQGAFMAFAAGAGGFKVVKSIIDSTEQSSDRFAIAMAGAQQATNALFKSIATGNLSDLGQRMREAAAAGREYAAALDLLEDRQRSVTIAAAKAKIPLSDLEEIFRDRSGMYTYEQRRKALQEYIRIYEGVQKQQINLNEFLLNETLKNHSKLSSLRREELIEVIEQYNKMTDTIVKAQDVITGEQQVKTKSSWWRELIAWIQEGAYGVEKLNMDIAYTMQEIKADLSNMNDEELRWYEMIKKYGTLSRKEIEEIKNSLIGAYTSQADLNSAKLETLRISAMITNEEKAHLAALKKANEMQGEMLSLKMRSIDTTTLKEGGITNAEYIVPGIDATINLVNQLDNAFQNLFANTGEGLKGMANAFKDALLQMAAQLAAKAALFGILTALTGGTGGVAMAATKILGGQGMLQFMGIPQFGKAPSGGMGNANINVTGIIKGNDIHLSNNRHKKLLNRHS